MPDEDPKGIQDVLADIMRDAKDLMLKEYRLFLLETRRAFIGAYVAVLFAVAAGIFVFVALLFAGEALLEWLAVQFGSRALAALGVTGVMTLIALILAFASYRQFMKASLVPKKTLASLRASRSAFFGGLPHD